MTGPPWAPAVSVSGVRVVGLFMRRRTNLGYRKPDNAPIISPTTVDFHWAAGIYEGEGSIAYYHSIAVSVWQKDAWILHRLRDLFGGAICPGDNGFQWTITGARGRGFIQSIYGLLSPRRQKQALAKFDWNPVL